MTELKTNPALLEALESAARSELTADELHKQRVSFIMGSVNDSDSLTRARVEEVLAVQEGKRTG